MNHPHLCEPEHLQFEPEPEGCGLTRIVVIAGLAAPVLVAIVLQWAGVFR